MAIRQGELADILRADLFRRFRYALALLALIGALMVATLGLSTLADPSRIGDAAKVTWPCLFFAWLLLWLYWSAGWSAKQQIATSGELASQTTHEFRDDGWSRKSSAGSSELAWEAVHSCRESKEVFALYCSNVAMVPLPKRMLQAPEDTGYFRD